MKIAFFSSDNYAGSGAFRAEINLIKDLKSHGHDVTLVLPCYGSGKQLAKQFNIKTKHILSAPWVYPIDKKITAFFLKTFSPVVNYFSSLRMKRFLKKNNFELAVINTLWTGAGAKAANKANIPFVWHMREILEAGQNHTFINPKKSYELINKANDRLAVSQCTRDYYSKYVKCENIKVVYDGVDSNVFYNNSKQLFKDETTHFLMLGTVNEPKGQHIGLKALNSLAKYNFDVKIVGLCSDLYKQKLLQLAPNIKNRVMFVPPTNHPEEFYKTSDIFLMNSVGEAFGLVTAEAMMEGLVVICADDGGGKEIISNSDNGYFYKPQDPIELAKKIEYVLCNKDQAKIIAFNGQKRSLENFSKDLNSQQIEKIYLSYSK